MAIDRAGKGTGGAISAWDERRRDRRITKRSSTKRVLPVAGAVTIRVARRASVCATCARLPSLNAKWKGSSEAVEADHEAPEV